MFSLPFSYYFYLISRFIFEKYSLSCVVSAKKLIREAKKTHVSLKVKSITPAHTHYISIYSGY